MFVISSYLCSMNKEQYEKHKAFAGEKKASMKRRFVGHDYTRRGIYMLTMTVEGRRPLFGRVYGSCEDPRIELTALGSAVRDEWWGIPNYYPQIKVFELQMMPDHLHGILFVSEPLPCHLSDVVRGFKVGCGRHYRRLIAPLSAATSRRKPSRVATLSTAFSSSQALTTWCFEPMTSISAGSTIFATTPAACS